MKKLSFLCCLCAILFLACATSSKLSTCCDMQWMYSPIEKEGDWFVPLLILGERPFELNYELTKTGTQYHIKGVIIDKVNNDTVRYPCLYQVSAEGERYRIVRKLCLSDVNGLFDCSFKSCSRKPCIVIDAVGYRGAAYIVTPPKNRDTQCKA